MAPLRELLLAANRRYLEFIFSIDAEDEELFESLGSGEFNISAFRNKDLRCRIRGKDAGQVSRLMQRLRTHGLIKRSEEPTSTTAPVSAGRSSPWVSNSRTSTSFHNSQQPPIESLAGFGEDLVI
jgi:hypothetical protein